jgi:hypothetical protein
MYFFNFEFKVHWNCVDTFSENASVACLWLELILAELKASSEL